MTILAFSYAATSLELQQFLGQCERQNLTDWEREFVASIRARRHEPTDKQMATLQKIARGRPDYAAINAAALRSLLDILRRWLPGGTVSGREYLARNPKRGDRTTGSFAVNTQTGKWADFSSGERGGDAISLAAWLFDLPQHEAAEKVATMLGFAKSEAGHG